MNASNSAEHGHALSMGRLLLLRAAYRVTSADPEHAVAVSDAVVSIASNCVSKIRSERSFTFVDCTTGPTVLDAVKPVALALNGSRAPTERDAAREAVLVMLKYRPTRQILFDAMVKLPQAPLMVAALGAVERTQGIAWDASEVAKLAPISLNALAVLVTNLVHVTPTTAGETKRALERLAAAAMATPINLEFCLGLLTHLYRRLPHGAPRHVFCEGALKFLLRTHVHNQVPWLTSRSSNVSGLALRLCRASDDLMPGIGSEEVSRICVALRDTVLSTPADLWPLVSPVFAHPRVADAVIQVFVRVAPSILTAAGDSSGAGRREALALVAGLVEDPSVHPQQWPAGVLELYATEVDFALSKVRAPYSTQRFLLPAFALSVSLTTTRVMILHHIAHEIRCVDVNDPAADVLRDWVWQVRSEDDVAPPVALEPSLIATLAKSVTGGGGGDLPKAYHVVDAVVLVAMNAVRAVDGVAESASVGLWPEAAVQLLGATFFEATRGDTMSDGLLEHWLKRLEAFIVCAEGLEASKVTQLSRVVVGALLLDGSTNEMMPLSVLSRTLPRTARRLKTFCRKAEKQWDATTRSRVWAALQN